MPNKIFQPNEYREEIKQLFRDGVPLEEIRGRFPQNVVPKSNLYRYKKEVEEEQSRAPAAPPVKKPTTTVSTVPGVGRESFTPQGTPANPPPGSQAGEWLTVGNIRIPTIDLGYSKSRNMFLVIDTFEIAKEQYNFPPNMKVGDFMAELCQAFRLMRGWDVIGSGVFVAKIEKEKEGEAR